jgi:uncharacterized protein (DUF433 family)
MCDWGRSVKQMAQQSKRIVREVHDEPHIEGTRITVQFVRERVEELGRDPEMVAQQHDLDIADVYRALTYYHDHPEEMRAVEQRRRERHERAADDPNVATGPEDVPE